METRQLLRPLGNCCRSGASLTTSTSMIPSSAAATGGRRHQSTAARTRKLLKISPHSSFLTRPDGKNHVIYNPPSAAPSVYHTPLKFLPHNDPRRQANLPSMLRASLKHQAQVAAANAAASAAAAAAEEAPLPPEATKADVHQKKYNVTRDEVAEMRELRARDPSNWSVLKLAQRFDCTPLFVMMCCRAGPEHREREHERLQAIKARWGPIRSGAREERQKRKKMLLRGAL